VQDRRPRRTTGAGLGAALLAVVLLAGCGSDAPTARPARASLTPLPTRSETPPPPGIHLSFIQQRFDEGTNRAQVRVINNTGRILYVRHVGVQWPGFPTGLQKMPYPVPGGLTVDLRYFLPRADCRQSAGTATAYAVVDTKRRRIRQRMPADGTRFLTRLWRTTCNERRIRHAATLSYGDSWSEEGSGLDAVLHGRLIVSRSSDTEAVTVDQVQGSVLFALRLPGGTMLPEGASRVSLPIDISPGRCDQHGRSQSTQSFVFRVWVRLAGGEPLAEVVQPTKPQQDRLLAFLDHACGRLSGG
jgi:hypothetical protein